MRTDGRRHNDNNFFFNDSVAGIDGFRAKVHTDVVVFNAMNITDINEMDNYFSSRGYIEVTNHDSPDDEIK